MPAYHYQPFDYVRPKGLDGEESRHKAAIIGAGPIGLALAIDLAQKGVPSVVLDDNNVVSVGSRAICWAKRTLEIFDRLGIGEKMLAKGVTWKTGRLFHGADEVYHFDLLPEAGHKYPAFINLQQYYVEEYLVERAGDFPDLIDLRFKNKVTAHEDCGDHVRLDIETPDGAYHLEADYVVACDGARSPTRKRMGLSFEGQTFDEQFLIIDVEMEESPFGTEVPERWFWFKPPFHHGQSALLHRQPDNLYRIDLQLGPGADAKAEADEAEVIPRIKAIVGDRPFRLDWMSVYRFRCAMLERFVHNRMIFCGDSAHVVSPFGARGGNGGIQDADNLGWKLASILKGDAGPALLESYDEERQHAARENILNSSRATNFMTPKSAIDNAFRDEVLRLAADLPFARTLINSGRLSVPCSLAGFPLQTARDHAPLATGSAFKDAPLKGPKGTVFLSDLIKDTFTLLAVGAITPPGLSGVNVLRIGGDSDYRDEDGLLKARYGQDLIYLLRPDGHVAAVFDDTNRAGIEDALLRAKGLIAEREAAE
ncbi:MAG: FAD-dependent oxidoreductase [Pseudomonadota bacterium]